MEAASKQDILDSETRLTGEEHGRLGPQLTASQDTEFPRDPQQARF
jgi:hypothetical protein